jgi:putative ABC transport system permease protein
MSHILFDLRFASRTLKADSVFAELRTAVRELDTSLPVTDVKLLEDYIGQSLAARRFLLGLLTTFSALAILLAGIGLYGVLAYSVHQQRREIGIRMTLGAGSSEVLWIVLRECLAIVIFGLAAGLLGAMWSSSFLKSMLFQTRSTDVLAYGPAVLLMIAIVLAASVIPALRASRVDPVSALRYE